MISNIITMKRQSRLESKDNKIPKKRITALAVILFYLERSKMIFYKPAKKPIMPNTIIIPITTPIKTKKLMAHTWKLR